MGMFLFYNSSQHCLWLQLFFYQTLLSQHSNKVTQFTSLQKISPADTFCSMKSWEFLVETYSTRSKTQPQAKTTASMSSRSLDVGTIQTWQDTQAASTEYRLFFAGVIAVVIFVGASALAIMARVLYRRKGTCQSQDVKAVRSEDSPEMAFSSSQNGPSENQKEYFI